MTPILAALGGLCFLPALADSPALPAKLSLRYQVEWRLVNAGWARLDYDAQNTARVHMESQGFVSKLYRVNDNYLAVLDAELCTSTVSMQAEEGSRKRETLITFDKERKRIRYNEKDLVKNQTMHEKAMVSGGCVNDVVGGLMRLRTLNLEPGQNAHHSAVGRQEAGHRQGGMRGARGCEDAGGHVPRHALSGERLRRRPVCAQGHTAGLDYPRPTPLAGTDSRPSAVLHRLHHVAIRERRETLMRTVLLAIVFAEGAFAQSNLLNSRGRAGAGTARFATDGVSVDSSAGAVSRRRTPV